MKGKKKVISKLLVSLMILNMIFSFNINTSHATVAEQTALDDKGMVEIYANSGITLRAGEIYYISIRGGAGGSGGNGYDGINGYGTGGGSGLVYSNYYQVDVTSDTNINVYPGSNGVSGGSRSGSTNGTGGAGGINSLSLGNGTSGSTPGGYYSGGGGGGGAASIITFKSNTAYRVATNGGNGGKGGNGSNETASGNLRYYAGGTGGVGGVVTQAFSGIGGVTIKQLSSAEGAGKISTPISPGAFIRKQRKPTTEPIKVGDLMTGEHIVLSNTVNGASTIFQKTANNFEFKYVSGEYMYYSGTSGVNLDWADFSKYAVSGSAQSNTMIVKVKQDLAFVGGDGTGFLPYYPEAAGSVGGGSSSSNDSYENTETLATSIISVATQIENILNLQMSKAMESVVVTDTEAPIIDGFMLLNGASVTTSNYATVELSIYDNNSDFENLKVQFRLAGTGWTTLQAPGYVMTPSLTTRVGLNNLYMRVVDESGNKVERHINFFRY